MEDIRYFVLNILAMLDAQQAYRDGHDPSDLGRAQVLEVAVRAECNDIVRYIPAPAPTARIEVPGGPFPW